MKNHDFSKYPKVVEYMKDSVKKEQHFTEGLKALKKITEANKYEWILHEAKL